jgi:uncharacterized iron-regulated membrane protein
MRRVLFHIHVWAGVLAGLYVFVVFVTGAALVYRIDLQRMLDPHLFTVRVAAPQADAATIMERVSAAYPDHTLAGVDAPTTDRPTYLAYVTRGAAFVTVLIDPVRGEILGELPERSVVRILQALHYDLMAGRTGRTINGIGAICVLVLCITGVAIWWPGTGHWRRGLSIDFGRSWTRTNRDLHRTVGIWTVTLIAAWALTGISFVFRSQVRAAVHAISPVTSRRPPVPRSIGPAPAARPSWREAVAAAATHAPHLHAARIVVPSSDRAPLLVLFAERQPTPAGRGHLTPIYLDQFTLERLPEPPAAPRTAGDIVMAWLTPLHVGDFGGEPIKAAWFVLGFAPPLLFVTGLVMWWTRVVRQRWRITRQP